MAAPTFVSAGTDQSGGGASVAFAVPAGTSAGRVVIIPLFIDGSPLAVNPSMPAGFALAEGAPVQIPATGGSHSLYLYYKRLTGSDAGTYLFSWSGSRQREGQALLYQDVVASGDPFDSPTVKAFELTNSNTSPALNVTSLGPDRTIIWAATNWGGGSWTAPSGFTERMDIGNGNVTLADMAWPTAGATGSVTGTCTGSDKRTAWMGALIGTTPGGGDPDPETVDGEAALTGSTALSVASSLVMGGASALLASGGLVASATVLQRGAVVASASAVLSVAGTVIRHGAVAVSAGASLAVTGTRMVHASASLSAAGAMSAQGRQVVLATVAQSGTSSLAALAQVVVQGGASLAGVAHLDVTGSTGGDNAVQLSATSSLTLAGVVLVRAGAALAASSTLTVSAGGVVDGSASLAAVAGLAAAGDRVIQASAALSAASTLTAEAVRFMGRIRLSASGSVAVAARQIVLAGTGLSSSTDVTMLSTVFPPILVPVGTLSGSVGPVGRTTSSLGGPRMSGSTGSAQGGTG